MTPEAGRWEHVRTTRLVLDPVQPTDIDEWNHIHGDPRVWAHYPQGRHTSRAATELLVDASIEKWDRAGLGYWSVRTEPGGKIIGCGGCRLVADRNLWNLYYRFAPEAQGAGYASELAIASINAANDVDPARPVIAIMLEHNVGSWRVAEKAGLTRIWVGPDTGNVDPDEVRYVYADRPDVEL